jgi:hypothetical protein
MRTITVITLLFLPTTLLAVGGLTIAVFEPVANSQTRPSGAAVSLHWRSKEAGSFSLEHQLHLLLAFLLFGYYIVFTGCREHLSRSELQT